MDIEDGKEPEKKVSEKAKEPEKQNAQQKAETPSSTTG